MEFTIAGATPLFSEHPPGSATKYVARPGFSRNPQ